MKIAFEEWLRNQDLSDDANGCFDESFLCYRTKAYRAALLFSYLGFLTVLRERLSAANPPPSIPVQMWEDRKRKLADENVWEETVFEAVEIQNPAPFFPVTDDLRREVRYWRDRRNDCAHFKRRAIDYAQVEGLWSFIQSRLAIFVVIGSSGDLLTRIIDHHDSTLTAPGRPSSSLVSALSELVLPTGYARFLDDLSSRLSGPDKGRTSLMAEASFLDGCLRYGSGPLKAAIETHVLKSEERQEKFLVRYPEHVGLLTGHPSRVRKLWKANFEFTRD
jgi:hypothetical protein